MAATMTDGDKMVAATLAASCLSKTGVTDPRTAVQTYWEVVNELQSAKLVGAMPGLES
jgi:hypothetical protein